MEASLFTVGLYGVNKVQQLLVTETGLKSSCLKIGGFKNHGYREVLHPPWPKGVCKHSLCLPAGHVRDTPIPSLYIARGFLVLNHLKTGDNLSPI